jgi:hypothetical protein
MVYVLHFKKFHLKLILRMYLMANIYYFLKNVMAIFLKVFLGLIKLIQ